MTFKLDRKNENQKNIFSFEKLQTRKAALSEEMRYPMNLTV